MSQQTPFLPVYLDIEIPKGSTWTRMLAMFYRDEATGENLLLDTAGMTAKMHIRDDYEGALWLEMTTGSGNIVTGIQGTAPYQYNVLLDLPNTKTALLPGGVVGVYDLELIDTSGRRYRTFEGKAKITPEVTI
jgi:hypothetical protein